MDPVSGARDKKEMSGLRGYDVLARVVVFKTCRSGHNSDSRMALIYERGGQYLDVYKDGDIHKFGFIL